MLDKFQAACPAYEADDVDVGSRIIPGLAMTP